MHFFVVPSEGLTKADGKVNSLSAATPELSQVS